MSLQEEVGYYLCISILVQMCFWLPFLPGAAPLL